MVICDWPKRIDKVYNDKKQGKNNIMQANNIRKAKVGKAAAMLQKKFTK